MPETRRSQRRAATDNAPATKLRLTLANDPYLNSPEFSTNLYSSAPYAATPVHGHQTRHMSKPSFASSSNSMDVDRSQYGLASPLMSDDESMSDEEMSPRGSGGANGAAGSRRRYTKRTDPASTGTLLFGPLWLTRCLHTSELLVLLAAEAFHVVQNVIEAALAWQGGLLVRFSWDASGEKREKRLTSPSAERHIRIAPAPCTLTLQDRFLTLFHIVFAPLLSAPPHTVSKGRPESENKVLRNREAAQQFRQRQREHILVLQAEHDKLVLENRAYQEHMSRLRLQREDLDRDINYARSFLEHTMSIAMANLRHSNRLDQLEPVMAHA